MGGRPDSPAWLGGGRWTTLAMLATLVLLLSIPAPVIATHGNGSNSDLSPCAAARAVPPKLHVDPNCIPYGNGSSDFDVDAVAAELDVHVKWAYEGKLSSVNSFKVYRGATPTDMKEIGKVSPNGEWEYVDQWAVLEGRSLWYAVGAMTDEGLIMSSPQLVQVAN